MISRASRRKETELEAMMNEGGKGKSNVATVPATKATNEHQKEAEAVKQAECCIIS
jgi:hypothetical protein